MIECLINRTEKTLTCIFSGKMDTINSDDAMNVFNKEIVEAKNEFKEDIKVVFDLKGVDYIASAFIRLCVMAAKSVEKGNFSIVNTEPQVKKVFKLAGLESLMNIS